MKKNALSSEKSYRELELELKQILSRLEQGAYEDLDDLLKDHAAGELLLGELQKKLDTAKLAIKKVNSTV